MKIEINFDIHEILVNACSAERIQPLVDKAISEAITDAIGKAAGYNSDFRKAVTKQLIEAIPHGLAVAEVAKFQHIMNSAVTDVVHAENSAIIKAAIQKAASAVLPEAPTRIKLSELMNRARGGLGNYDGDKFYANLTIDESGYGWLALDSDSGCRNEYSASVRLGFDKGGNVYSLKLDGRDITPKIFPDVVGNFDGLLMSMYVGRTSLEIDMDADDVEITAMATQDD